METILYDNGTVCVKQDANGNYIVIKIYPTFTMTQIGIPDNKALRDCLKGIGESRVWSKLGLKAK